MTESTILHEWNVSPIEAIIIQKKLRTQIVLKPLRGAVKAIAGADVSLSMFKSDVYAGIVVLSYPELEIIDQAFVKMKTPFPYIPGLLSFREIPGLLEAWAKLSIKPDLVMVDGQGIAHPRRLGIATHFGILINTPTIGVAKSVLTGIYREPTHVGQEYPLIDKKTSEVIGAVLKSKKGSNPLIISAGHLITLSESVSFVRNCLRGYKLPLPTHQAHLSVNKFRVEDALHLKEKGV